MSAATDWKPSPKIVGGGLACAITTILLWLVDEFTTLSPPAAVVGAISLVVTTGVAYLVPGGDQVLSEDPDGE
jgi:hypothetical protein